MYCARCGHLVGVRDSSCAQCGADLNIPGALRLTDPKQNPNFVPILPEKTAETEPEQQPAAAEPVTAHEQTEAKQSTEKAEEPTEAENEAEAETDFETDSETVSETGLETDPETGSEIDPEASSEIDPATEPETSEGNAEADDTRPGSVETASAQAAGIQSDQTEANTPETDEPVSDEPVSDGSAFDEPASDGTASDETASDGSALDESEADDTTETPISDEAEELKDVDSQLEDWEPEPVDLSQLADADSEQEPAQETPQKKTFGEKIKGRFADLKKKADEFYEKRPSGTQAAQMLGISPGVSSSKITVLCIILLATFVVLFILTGQLVNIDRKIIKPDERRPLPTPSALASASDKSDGAKSAAPTETSSAAPTEKAPAPTPQAKTPAMSAGAKECSAGVWAGADTNCDLAAEVAAAVDPKLEGKKQITVHSQSTNRQYNLQCRAEEGITCQGTGNDSGIVVWLVVNP